MGQMVIFSLQRKLTGTHSLNYLRILEKLHIKTKVLHCLYKQYALLFLKYLSGGYFVYVCWSQSSITMKSKPNAQLTNHYYNKLWFREMINIWTINNIFIWKAKGKSMHVWWGVLIAVHFRFVSLIEFFALITCSLNIVMHYNTRFMYYEAGLSD